MAQSVEYQVLNKPIPRVEGPDKVTGRAAYAADVTPAGSLWAKNVRSPHPHARILSIDASRALRVPGVVAVLTAADIPNPRIGRRLKDTPLFCDDRVRFVGDKVAAVAAEAADAAEEAALLVEVEYEELPAVFDPLEAMQPGAPLIHPDRRSYVGFPDYITEEMRNVCAYHAWERGDIEAGFREADVTLEHTFDSQLMHQGYIEPHACVVSIAESGRGEIWASSKVPFSLRKELASILQLSEEQLVVHAVTVGGDFGSKGAPGDVPLAYHLARRTGRPVKFVMTSHEDLIATAPRSPGVITLRTGIKRDGRIVARQARVVFDSGAYGGFRPAVLDGMLPGAAEAAGCYEIPNLHAEAFIVYTNKVPCGYMRSPGQPQVIFAVEAHMDLLARELGMDPLALRLKNLARPDGSGAEGPAPRVLRAAAEAIGWNEAKGDRREAGGDASRLVGRGMALCERGTGTGTGSSAVTVNPDGTVTATTSLPDNGTGGLTVVAQIVAESFGVPLERVRLVHGDTDSLPVDVEAGASRMTNVAGHAAIAACDQIKEQLAPLAARMLNVSEVEWTRDSHQEGGWKAADGRFVTLNEVAREMLEAGDPSASAQVTVSPPRTAERGYCVQAAEVEVDAETGEVHLRRLVTAQEVGTIINTIGHQGQIEGAVVQGIGYTLMEELTHEEGIITAGHLGEYKLPTIRDLPELVTVNIPSTGPGPFEAKAIGEIPIVPTAGAIANAVMDAIGGPILQLPITAERVLEAHEGAERGR